LLKAYLFVTFISGRKGESGNWKNEWIVIPPALIAATPVGATIRLLFVLCFLTARRKVVFPVPGGPY